MTVLAFMSLVFSPGSVGTSIFRTTLIQGFGISLIFLVGPLVFFYVRGLLSNNTKISASDHLHFTIFILQLAGIVPYFHSTGLSLIPAGVNLSLCIVHLFIYMVIVLNLIVKYKKINLLKFLNVKSYRLMIRWLVFFTSTVAVLTGTIIYSAFSRDYLVAAGKMTDSTHAVSGNNEWILLLAIIILLLFSQIICKLPWKRNKFTDINKTAH
jgi:hypothetical protein